MAETTTTQPQEMVAPQPQKEHQWLQKLVGEWTYEGEASMGPDQPPSRMEGRESARSVGGLWVIMEGHSASPSGGEDTSMFTLGYDPDRKQFTGTFISSMMTHLWIYDSGELSGNALTLTAKGPSMTGDGAMVPYRDVIEFVSDDHRTLSSYAQDEKGAWQHFMTSHYRRKK